MQRYYVSPVVERIESWALVNDYTLNWGRDENGEMWVAVENRQGECEGYLPYADYLCGGDPAACCHKGAVRYGDSRFRK